MAVHAQDGSAVSTERISEALKRPELEIPAMQPQGTPTFRVTVESEWAIETPLQAIRRELAEEAGSAHRIVPGAGMTPPLVAVDVFPAIVGAINHIRDIRYAHAVADARQRVAEDLATFCVEHDCTPAESPATEGVIVTPTQQPNRERGSALPCDAGATIHRSPERDRRLQEWSGRSGSPLAPTLAMIAVAGRSLPAWADVHDLESVSCRA